MDDTLRVILTTIPGAVLGLASLVWQWKKDRRRAPLEDSDTAVDTSASAAQALKSYSDEVIRLRGELAEMRMELAKLKSDIVVKEALIQEWRDGIDRLISQMRSVNLVPVWQPRNGEK